MAHHYRLGSFFNQMAVHHAIGIVPRFRRQGIHRGHKMLIPLIHAIPGKMLDRSGHSLFLAALHIGGSHLHDHLGAASESPGIRDRIAEIIVNVDYGRKGVIGSNTAAFNGAYFA
ncbi:hypothetical protein D3C87_1557160 [compost metagenome]